MTTTDTRMVRVWDMPNSDTFAGELDLQTMNENEQRIAIAEFCGIKITAVEDGVPFMFNPYNGKVGGLQPISKPVPDYLHDLNAMHSAVMEQSAEFRLRFEDALKIAGRDLGKLVCELPALIHARIFLQVKRDSGNSTP